MFQLLLALGFPYSQYAYGGKYDVLPTSLRIMSFVAIIIFAIASILVLAKADVIQDFAYPDIAEHGTWFFAFYLGLNTLMNTQSINKWEKRIMTPLSLTVSLSCLIVALGL